MKEDDITWIELFHRAEKVIGTTLAAASSEGKPLLLQPTTRPGSLLLLAVGLLWPHAVILDEKHLLDDQDALRLSEALIDLRLVPTTARIRGGQGLVQRDFAGWDLILCTSGSTGTPKRIVKSGKGLLAEVRDLTTLYRWDASTCLLSLVSPLHIYGLLHSFLLPLGCDASVEFVNFQSGPVDPQTLNSEKYAGVIAVPATWSFVKDLLQSKEIGTIVMSGSAFGERRRQELQDMVRKPDRALEILGSTETGGLGFRPLLDSGDSFQPLPAVRLGNDWVESPYLWPDVRCPLTDRLEILEDGSFLHSGRMDRIFKYAGQRYALAEVEAALAQCFQDSEVLVRFFADESVAQGGWLEAWIESAPITANGPRREEYRRLTSAPFPHVLHFMEAFPRDMQGKPQILNSMQGDGNRLG